MTEIEPYLRAVRVQTKLLVDFGIVAPMFPKRPHLDHLSRQRDLDRFLDRIFVDAVPVEDPDEDMADVQKAVERVCCSTIGIVRLIDRKLSRAGRRASERGFAALLVHVSEIRSIMRGSMDVWLAAKTIETTMRTTSKDVRNLIDGGFLTVETIIRPLNRCPAQVVKQTAFNEFRREYASLFEAMEMTGIHFLKIQKQLTAIGIEPAIRREDVGAAFHRRSDLQRL